MGCREDCAARAVSREIEVALNEPAVSRESDLAMCQGIWGALRHDGFDGAVCRESGLAGCRGIRGALRRDEFDRAVCRDEVGAECREELTLGERRRRERKTKLWDKTENKTEIL